MKVARATGSCSPPANGRRSVRAATPVAAVITSNAGAAAACPGNAAASAAPPASAPPAFNTCRLDGIRFITALLRAQGCDAIERREALSQRQEGGRSSTGCEPSTYVSAIRVGVVEVAEVGEDEHAHRVAGVRVHLGQ